MYRSPASGLSAVHIAAGAGRVEILPLLVGLGDLEDVRAMDGQDWTPMCYATNAGNMEVMEILSAAGAGVDDGSLHIASGNINIACMQLLKSHGHSVQCPGQIRAMEGRFPLAELCYAARGSGPSWDLAVEEAIKELQPLLDSTWRFRGGNKTVLHLAIDNPTSAFPVLRAFLSVSKLYANPNRDEEYLYTDDNSNLCYSPTEYVKRLCPAKPPEERAQLHSLLKANQFRDRFFSVSGNQPEGARGLPDELAQDIQRNKQDDWKTKENMKRERLVAQQNKQLQDETHHRQMNYTRALHHEDFTHTDRMQGSQQAHQSSMGAIQIQTQQALADITLRTEQRRLDMASGAHQLEGARQSSQNRRELEHAKSQRAIELQHHVNLALLQHQVRHGSGAGYAGTIDESRRIGS